jgi:hypothetical protein
LAIPANHLLAWALGVHDAEVGLGIVAIAYLLHEGLESLLEGLSVAEGRHLEVAVQPHLGDLRREVLLDLPKDTLGVFEQFASDITLLLRGRVLRLRPPLQLLPTLTLLAEVPEKGRFTGCERSFVLALALWPLLRLGLGCRRRNCRLTGLLLWVDEATDSFTDRTAVYWFGRVIWDGRLIASRRRSFVLTSLEDVVFEVAC